MSSEKILQKISEKDIKENLTDEQYAEYLENEKIEKLEQSQATYPTRLFEFCKICLARVY